MIDGQDMDFDYASALVLLKQRDNNDRNEEDVKVEIVEPVLRHGLGYESQNIRREHQLQSQRTDFLCLRPDGKLDVIVEAKALGVNLDLRPSQSAPATRIPKIQLEEYLRKRPDSSHGVFGLLTNGEEWRVCRRIEKDIVWLSSAVAPTWKELRNALLPLLSRAALPSERSKYSTTKGLEILSHIASTVDHQYLMDQVRLEDHSVERHTDLVSSMRLAQVPDETSDLLPESHFVTIGSRAQDGILSVADIYDALRETYLLHTSINASGIGIAFDARRETVSACRVFTWDGKTLHTSNSFDPELPGTRVLRQLESLARWRDGEPNKLIEQLNARTVQKEFYDEIASWFERTGTELNDLRHLIRILFTWFLKEHGVIPSELFEKHGGICVHEQLEHLFTRTLSMESGQRMTTSRLYSLKEAFYDAPFLNGSLFNDDHNLLRERLADAEYVRAGESDAGLFTILKRYDWTLTENDDVRSDTALDPSMIGSVFERFIALAEKIEPGPLARQPDGTYYTPQDLTDEMVCDALAYDLEGNVEGVSYENALQLLHPSEGDSQVNTQLFSSPLKQMVVNRLRKVTVLDPCTGSGEFIVSVLNSLRRAERRLLRDEYDDLDRVNHAIASQLYAVDVHPMAIQVTRFRFYLAMIGTQLSLQPNLPLGPFPNLETRVAAANSLATRLIDSELELEGSHLSSSDTQEWRRIRDSYTDAHSPDRKKKIQEREAKARQELVEGLPFALPHVSEWLKNESLGNESIVSQCGIRLLFGRERWDVVIGNPPYQRPSRNEKVVAEQYGYVTASCGDLYCLFVELGTKLLSEHGVLTMVVPHSICFAARKRKLRAQCSKKARAIYLRTYNNRPSAVFPPHPFIKGGNQAAQNVQRVTVMSITLGGPNDQPLTKVQASCYIGLQDGLRKEILRCRPSHGQPLADQWTMAGTELLSELLTKMHATGTRASETNAHKVRDISYPPTAGYFLSAIPCETLDLEKRKTIGIPDDEFFWSRICLFNSTLFHAYWLMIGDAFHILPSTFYGVNLPPAWNTDLTLRNDANAIGREFCDHNVLKNSRTELRRYDQTFPNFNFQDNVPHLVLQADRVCIRGYGLGNQEAELLKQIQRLRQFRTWDM